MKIFLHCFKLSVLHGQNSSDVPCYCQHRGKGGAGIPWSPLGCRLVEDTAGTGHKCHAIGGRTTQGVTTGGDQDDLEHRLRDVPRRCPICCHWWQVTSLGHPLQPQQDRFFLISVRHTWPSWLCCLWGSFKLWAPAPRTGFHLVLAPAAATKTSWLFGMLGSPRFSVSSDCLVPTLSFPSHSWEGERTVFRAARLWRDLKLI